MREALRGGRADGLAFRAALVVGFFLHVGRSAVGRRAGRIRQIGIEPIFFGPGAQAHPCSDGDCPGAPAGVFSDSARTARENHRGRRNPPSAMPPASVARENQGCELPLFSVPIMR